MKFQLTSKDINEIKNICRENKVKSLYLFGSATSDKFNNKSDIDLLVDFEDVPPEHYYDHYYNLKEFLKKYFKRNIDLLEARALRNPYLIKEINLNKVLIYG
jgi:predicted nucleotidyltransferase